MFFFLHHNICKFWTVINKVYLVTQQGFVLCHNDKQRGDNLDAILCLQASDLCTFSSFFLQKQTC